MKVAEFKKKKDSLDKLFAIILGIIFVIALNILGLAIYAIFNPGIIGEFFGEVIRGFNSVNK